MKFYAAQTTGPIKLELVVHDEESEPVIREFPAGTEVSATPATGDVWHLNAHPDPANEWETWQGYTPKSKLVIGEVIATINEGK